MVSIRAALVLVTALLAPSVSAQTPFETWSTGGTLRFDYFHGGTGVDLPGGGGKISVDAVRVEPTPWPGRRTGMVDRSNRGKYSFEVARPADGEILFSQGFASIYGEWETTGEARSGVWRTFHESQRFPEPRQPVELVLKKRDAAGVFREFFRTTIDPASRFVDRSRPEPSGRPVVLWDSGAPAEVVDLLILGDGYTAAERGKFEADARKLANHLFAFPPFDRLKERFSVRALAPASAQAGVTDPRADRWVASPLGLSYNIFDSERYMLTLENRALRDVAAHVPYDALILLANSEKYGGGGIYNLYSTAAADSPQAPYLVVHELGHSFAGLGDEYYTSPVSYEDFNPPGVEPWEPNVTALLDPSRLKWRHLMNGETPLPTPWDQAAYDTTSRAFQEQRRELRGRGVSEERMEEYFAEVKRVTGSMLADEPHAGEVGAFEGSSYQAKGLYRPSVDCIMFSRNPGHFCPVCTEAIEATVDLLTGVSSPSP